MGFGGGGSLSRRCPKDFGLTSSYIMEKALVISLLKALCLKL